MRDEFDKSGIAGLRRQGEAGDDGLEVRCSEIQEELESRALENQAFGSHSFENHSLENQGLEMEAVAGITHKRSGETAEARFLAKASGLGFGVAKPWGDSERYDFILDYGQGLLRVQVKSTTYEEGARYGVKTSGFTKSYTKDQIDFLVAYVVPEDAWYVLPMEAFTSRKRAQFYPRGGGKGKMEKYREAWCLMTLAMRKKQRTQVNELSRKLRVCRCERLAVRCAVCPMVRGVKL